MNNEFVDFLRQKLTKAEIAIGMATVLKPDMAITPDDPVGTVEQVVAHVRKREAELLAVIKQCHRYAKKTLPDGYLAEITSAAIAKAKD